MGFRIIEKGEGGMEGTCDLTGCSSLALLFVLSVSLSVMMMMCFVAAALAASLWLLLLVASVPLHNLNIVRDFILFLLKMDMFFTIHFLQL